MTDLTEMVEWLRREIESEKLAAEKATPGPWRWSDLSGQVREDSQFGRAVTTAARTVADLVHIATHDPRDTIARCGAELAIIDAHYPIDPCDAHDASLNTIACPTLEHLAHGRRHRPGWKEGWAS